MYVCMEGVDEWKKKNSPYFSARAAASSFAFSARANLSLSTHNLETTWMMMMMMMKKKTNNNRRQTQT